MTYIFSASYLPRTSADAFWVFKNLSVAAGFVVVSSSDGTSLQAGDVHTTSGTLENANAYYILKQPLSATGSYGGWRREWGIQRGANGQSWRISYTLSSSHQFGGTASTMPSGSDRRWVLETSTQWQLGGYATGVTDADGNYFMHSCVDNAPPYGWYMIFQPVGKPAGGAALTTVVDPYGGLYFDPLLTGSYAPNDLDPTVQFIVTAQQASSFLANSTLGPSSHVSGTVNNPPKAWMGYNLSGGVFTSVSALFPAFTNASIANVTNATSTNIFTGKDDIFPIYYLKPTPSITAFVNVSGLKGVSSLLKLKLSPRASNTLYSISSSMDGIVFGDYIFPWSSSLGNAIK